MFGWFLQCCHAVRRVQMPADGLSAVLHLHGKIRVQSAGNDRVVAHRPVAVQAHPRQLHHQGVSRHRRLHIERPRLWISSQYTRQAFLIRSASIHCRRMHRVPRRNSQHRFVRRRKLPVKRCRREFVPLRHTHPALRSDSRRELMCVRMRRVASIGEHDCPGDGSVFHCGCAFLRAPLLVFGNKMDRIASNCSFELVARKISHKFSRLFLQMHLVEKRCPENVRIDDPSAGNASVRCTCCILCIQRLRAVRRHDS